MNMNKKHAVSLYHIYIYFFFSCVKFPFVAFLHTHTHTMFLWHLVWCWLKTRWKWNDNECLYKCSCFFTSCRHCLLDAYIFPSTSLYEWIFCTCAGIAQGYCLIHCVFVYTCVVAVVIILYVGFMNGRNVMAKRTHSADSTTSR